MGGAGVFLDRDGTLNRTYGDRPPHSLAELVLLPGVAEALARLKRTGFALAVVTNQPDVARGTVSRLGVEAINDSLKRKLPLDEIVVCYHDDSDNCVCRKPKPGMLVEAARRCGVDLARSYMVGDRWRDIGAGRSAGCTTIYLSSKPSDSITPAPDFAVRNLAEAVEIIVSRRSARQTA